ncbi:MAG: hypothetical protein CMI54_08795 [Parcubacteria group bacterium]|jgi:hypothetical protein|nr:hypothetical protein [Parcubacteria group bacterium]|tara:strand:- start:663 stop:908 length:246 start_codon:yes stop_codon:yes gene_type:complete
MKGTSTGQPQYDKKKAQKREIDRQNQSIHGNFGGGDLKPTPEQLEKRQQREEREKQLEARKYEKRHRGGYHKTKKGRKRNK